MSAQSMLLAPYYRTYELAWEGDPETSARFRKILRAGLILFVILSLLFPLLPRPKPTAAEEAVPPRLARVMIENQVKPPPPPPPPVEEKPKIEPEKKVAAVKPPVDRAQRARERAQATMEQFQDELADLREQMDLTPLEQTKNLTGAVGADSHAERSLIAAKVGRGSGGITSANTSRGFGTGAGSLTGHETGTVTSNIARADRGPTRTGTSGKAARSREEIELVFDRNKGALHALYTRALRDKPELQGKLVLEFTVAPSGEVTMCRVVSSELDDTELERKIVARVRLFRFEARDVEVVTTTKPIDFLPSGAAT
jgi:protein TonB